MVLTITLNPLLERRLTFEHITPGSENRTQNESFSAGGKGINVSRQLGKLNVQNNALTFIGGNNGKLLRHLITDEKIICSFSQTKSETRHAVLVKDESSQKLTTFFGPNSVVEESEKEDLKQKLAKMTDTCQIVVFSGSSPSKVTDDLIPYGISLTHETDRISLCDTYGSILNDCIEAAPTILHNNITETEKSLGIKLDTEERILEYLSSLYNKGIKQVYLTNGDKPFYASNFGFHYKVEVPSLVQLDSTGSGDAFVAGIVFGLCNALAFEESLRFAAACGCANAAKWDVCNVTYEQAAAYAEKIKISTIGKKINNLQL